MPMIWIRGKEKTFHLTGSCDSWEGEFDTPDKAVDARKCKRVGGSRFEIHAGSKILLFDITPQGRTGDCIRCGQCCSHKRHDCPDPKTCGFVNDGKYHVCEHLEVIFAKGAIGKQGGTACKIYDRLLDDSFKGCLEYPDKADPQCCSCRMRFDE